MNYEGKSESKARPRQRWLILFSLGQPEHIAVDKRDVETTMTSSASIAQHLAMVIMGIIYAAILAVLTGSLWPGTGLFVFVLFLAGWGLGMVNTIALERRHPELILPSTWTFIKVRYKPWQLRNNEYEITLAEFVRGQLELIIYGVPLGLFVGGLVGILWPTGKWLAFMIVFGVWTALMIAGIISAIQRR
jgi:hypothetical protein